MHQSFTQHPGMSFDRNGKQPIRPIRLSIITQFYPPDYAATGQLIEELATHLARQGMQVHIFTGQPGYAFGQSYAPPIEQLEKILVQRSRSSRILSQRIRGKAINGLLFFLRSGLHLLRNSSSRDILMLTTAPPFLSLLGYFANVCFGIPYVCLLYDLYPDVAVELKVVSSKNLLVRLWNYINNVIWRKAQTIVVLSPSMKKRVETKCPEIPSEKISVIHSWANPNRIIPIPKHQNWFSHQYNLVEKFSVLYSGNMGRCHDMDTILDAAWQLKDEPIQFVFIGNGAKRQALRDRVRTLGLKNCLFLPYQDKQHLPYSLTSCDLSLVSISVGMEGLVAPSKLYGILAAGCPVAIICEPHSYLRQLIAEANCGEAFDNGDSTGLADFIRRLAKDIEQSHQMGASGRRYLQSNFTPEIVAREYQRILTIKQTRPLTRHSSF